MGRRRPDEKRAQAPVQGTMDGHLGGEVVFVAGRKGPATYVSPPPTVLPAVERPPAVVRTEPAQQEPAGERGVRSEPVQEEPAARGTPAQASATLLLPRCGQWKVERGTPMTKQGDGWAPRDSFTVERMEGRYMLRRNGHAVFWLDETPGGMYVHKGERDGPLPGYSDWFVDLAELGSDSLNVTWGRTNGDRAPLQFRLRFLDALTSFDTVLGNDGDLTDANRDWAPKTGEYRSSKVASNTQNGTTRLPCRFCPWANSSRWSSVGLRYAAWFATRSATSASRASCSPPRPSRVRTTPSSWISLGKEELRMHLQAGRKKIRVLTARPR